MRFWLSGLLILSVYSMGCMQAENSNSQDASIYGGSGSPEFIAARAVLAASCSNCHPFHSQSEGKLIEDGMIVPGNPSSSKLYYRLSGTVGPDGPKNMPTGGSLSQADITVIADWISVAQ